MALAISLFLLSSLRKRNSIEIESVHDYLENVSRRRRELFLINYAVVMSRFVLCYINQSKLVTDRFKDNKLSYSHLATRKIPTTGMNRYCTKVNQVQKIKIQNENRTERALFPVKK